MVAISLPEPVAIEELVSNILIERRVTRSDRAQLMRAFLSDTLVETEIVLIDRMLYGLRKGLLQLTD